MGDILNGIRKLIGLKRKPTEIEIQGNVYAYMNAVNYAVFKGWHVPKPPPRGELWSPPEGFYEQKEGSAFSEGT